MYKITPIIILFLLPLFIFILLSPTLSASTRIRPEKIDYKCLKVKFNNEPLDIFYIVIDTRTDEEKQADRKRGHLSGSVIVFFHGHAQRPNNGFNLLAEMAMKTKSGIIIIPVCDTPYGSNEKWRGDSGKMVILMELVRYLLHEKKISIEGYQPLTDLKLVINNTDLSVLSMDTIINAKILAVGYSHGGIISRQFANAYPDAVVSLVHFCAAGYIEWGGKNCIGPVCITGNFMCESCNIGLRFFSHPGDTIDSSWGLTKGIVGDSLRSYSSCLFGNFNCLKPFRNFRDAKDASIYIDDSNYPVSHLKNIVVVFAQDDTLFDPAEIIGVDDYKNITRKVIEEFWTKFYPQEVAGGTRLTLRILPGTHLGPIVYHDQYIEIALKGTDEFRLD
ncbi:MAG: hypothetical protein SVZ03_11720 [Spirochaetota bacterium]|nr:hypothetical protein [Spirochaetota bacterium]